MISPGIQVFFFPNILFRAFDASFSGGRLMPRRTNRRRSFGDSPYSPVSTAPGVATVTPTPMGLNSYQMDLEKL